MTFALAIDNSEGDSSIHTLSQQASYAGKFAGLSGKDAIALVSSNLNTILGLKGSSDLVIWEGDPLEYGASVVASFDGEDGSILTCWPTAQ